MRKVSAAIQEVDEIIGMRYSLLTSFQEGLGDLGVAYDARPELLKQNQTLQTERHVTQAVEDSAKYETETTVFLRNLTEDIRHGIGGKEEGVLYRQNIIAEKINSEALPRLRQQVLTEKATRSQVVGVGIFVRNFVVGEMWRSVIFGRDFADYVMTEKIRQPDDTARRMFDEWGYVIGGSYLHSASMLQTKSNELKRQLGLG